LTGVPAEASHDKKTPALPGFQGGSEVAERFGYCGPPNRQRKADANRPCNYLQIRTADAGWKAELWPQRDLVRRVMVW